MPSKTLLRAAKAVGEIRRARDFGIKVPESEIDFAAVMERVRRVRAELAPTDAAREVADWEVAEVVQISNGTRMTRIRGRIEDDRTGIVDLF